LCRQAPARADELLPADRSVEEAIDHYIEARLRQESLTPAPLADDATLLRRTLLDLAGRIPTAAEVDAYLASSEPDKRVKLVERLLASPGFVRHQANEFDVLLSAGKPGPLRDYFAAAFAENRSWDRVFRDLLLPTDNDRQKGPGSFLKQRVMDLDRLTNEVSVLFFGVNVSCAQCHDHPQVPDWKQDHFFGMKAFFARTVDNGGFLAERTYGLVKFKPNKGAEKTARMMFLTGKVVDDPGAKEPSAQDMRKEKALFDEYKRKRQAPPAPAFSARARLVEIALAEGQRDFFARSLVNRVWQRHFGLGLVNPVDQMHSENPPTHPELLAWLARDTVAHGYDVKRLIRGIVLSRAYARASRWEGPSPPRPTLFALARVRPLTPAQLATSLRLATADPLGLAAGKPDELEKKIEGLERSAAGFASQIEQPREDFQIGVGEALLFSNSDRVQREFLADSGDRLLGRLKQIRDVREKLEMAVRCVLCRAPRPDEMQALTDYVGRRADRQDEAIGQVVWALLTGAEFRFNH
jgi:hypothetical protein